MSGALVLAAATALVAAGRCQHAKSPAAPASLEQRLRVRVVASYPHDPEAYTQGLLWHQGALYEGTGQYGNSSIRRVDLATGRVEARAELPADVFGEGIARVGESLLQISWHEGRAFRFALPTLQLLGEVPFRGEGWGLAFDGTSLIMSDGSPLLTVRDPQTLAVMRTVAVTRRGVPLAQLNELELVEGTLYANLYQSDEIVAIEPSSGRVRATIDAGSLRALEWGDRAEALNGIAYRPETGTFLVTGKWWPRIFEVTFEPAPP